MDARGRRRRGPRRRRHDGPRDVPHAVLHARRHPRRGQVPRAPPTTTRLGAEIVLGNTYHLMLRPGADVIARFGGLGAFSGWDGLTLTDSGGFQVFSLEPKVDDDGVTFRSVYDGSTHRLTPEIAVATQELLGADIQMVLDVCPPLPSPPAVIDLAVERTAAWAARARAAHRREDQALFGIVQGGVDRGAAGRRAPSARPSSTSTATASAAVSVGETRAEMLPALAAALADLPDRPAALPDGRRRPGVARRGGRPRRRPVRLRACRPASAATARRSRAPAGSRVKAARHADEDEPLDPTCRCAVCARHSRGYLRHLFAVGEPTASRLVSLHNLAWTFALLARACARRSSPARSPRCAPRCSPSGPEPEGCCPAPRAAVGRILRRPRASPEPNGTTEPDAPVLDHCGR